MPIIVSCHEIYLHNPPDPTYSNLCPWTNHDRVWGLGALQVLPYAIISVDQEDHKLITTGPYSCATRATLPWFIVEYIYLWFGPRGSWVREFGMLEMNGVPVLLGLQVSSRWSTSNHIPNYARNHHVWNLVRPLIPLLSKHFFQYSVLSPHSA